MAGKWTPDEEQRLASAVRDLSSTKPGESVTAGISWAIVAERVGTRSEKQCRSKWYGLFYCCTISNAYYVLYIVQDTTVTAAMFLFDVLVLFVFLHLIMLISTIMLISILLFHEVICN